MSVWRRLARQSYRTFGQGHSMPSRLARKSYRTFGQGLKSYPVYTRTKLFLLGTAWKLSGSYRELPGGCPGIAGSCQEAVRELLGAAGSCRKAVRDLPAATGGCREAVREPAGSLPGACQGLGAVLEACQAVLGPAGRPPEARNEFPLQERPRGSKRPQEAPNAPKPSPETFV